MAEEPTITQTGYLSDDDADDIAEQILGVANYAAATAANKQKALNQASIDIDTAMRYQGRKYDTTQTLEFPRVAYESGLGAQVSGFDPYGYPSVTAETVWDLDLDTGEAVVPDLVKQAVVYQAESILAGDRDERLDTQHDQVSSHGADGLQEAYAGQASVLCRRAFQIMQKYRLKTGGMI